MNPFYRLFLAVFRMVAAGFMVVTMLDLGVYWVKSRHNQTPMTIGHCVYLSIPLVIGVVMLVKSPALARRAAEYVDD